MSQAGPVNHTATTGDKKLDPKDLLIAEFNYIADNVFQANEDRARVSSYYFVTAAAVVAAIVGVKLDSASVGVYWGLALMFAVLSAIGLFTLLQLARLRIAWNDSVKAMNRVMKYYIEHASANDLPDAFEWYQPNTIPSPDRVRSKAFLLALSVITICFGTTSASVVYTGLGIFAAITPGSLPDPWGNICLGTLALVTGLCYAYFQIREYFQWVRELPNSQKPIILETVLKRLRLL